MDISLTDEFDNPTGQFVNYDAYEAEQRSLIGNLKHVDIRTMHNTAVDYPITVFYLSYDEVGDMNNMTMSDFNSEIEIVESENWSSPVVYDDKTTQNVPPDYPITVSYLGKYKDVKLNTFTVNDISGNTQTIASQDIMHTGGFYVVKDTVNGSLDITSTSFAADISGMDDNDFISVALPDFPASSLNLSTSYLEFIDGDGASDQITLNNSIVPLVTGYSEFRCLINSFDSIDLSNIVTVKIHLVSTSSCVVKIMGIRALSNTWQYSSINIDTRYNRLVKTIPLNGVVSDPLVDQPIVWRSSTPSGNDPRPIDSKMSVLFNTGRMDGDNTFSLYFRELTEDFLTMLDLDGEEMWGFDGHDQPDVGDARYNPRFQSDLDSQIQSSLDALDQFNLERTPDYLSASWIEFSIAWNSERSSTFKIRTTESDSSHYSFDGPDLEPNKSYAFYTFLEENEVQCKLYELTDLDEISDLIFDSNTIVDDTLFKRRKGRFGWSASFDDSTAYLKSINERGLLYGEYRSLPFESVTPVEGAQLFVSTSPNINHFEYFTPSRFNDLTKSEVDRDSTKTTTDGESWKFVNYGSTVAQGLTSNYFSISDFSNSEITLDVYYPATSTNAGEKLSFALIDPTGVKITPLFTPEIFPDQWQSIRIKFPDSDSLLPGKYALFIYQIDTVSSTWWVDNINVFTRTVSWDGRAMVDDPWSSNDASWVPFLNEVNDNKNGILFANRGKELQVRGKALRQSSSIGRIQFKPKYAELGNIRIETELPNYDFSSSFSYTDEDENVKFISSGSNSGYPGGYISNSEWNFGDGTTGVGEIVFHQYPNPGNYIVNNIVTDSFGNKLASSQTITVS